MLKITIIAMGNKMPQWVEQAVNDFTARLRENVSLALIEVPLTKRGKTSDLSRILEKEMQLMKAHIPPQAHLIALDIEGRGFSSDQLAVKLEQLQQITSHLCFLIGGPEGLCKPLLNTCHEKWSLSQLTLPHTLARIVLLETLYRAWSIIHHHPYHK